MAFIIDYKLLCDNARKNSINNRIFANLTADRTSHRRSTCMDRTTSVRYHQTRFPYLEVWRSSRKIHLSLNFGYLFQFFFLTSLKLAVCWDAVQIRRRESYRILLAVHLELNLPSADLRLESSAYSTVQSAPIAVFHRVWRHWTRAIKKYFCE